MGKKFNQWLDEFVDNGANPKDVTNWPKNAGGGSYTAGNGITITDENVINADVKTVQVNHIEDLTNEQCEALNSADVVIENDAYIYIVTNKNASNLNLVLILNNEVDEVHYLKDADSWEYDSTTTSMLDEFKIVYLYDTAGDVNEEDIQKIIDGAFVMINETTMLLPVAIIDAHGSIICEYCSAVLDNEYKVCTITITSDTQASYTVNTETIGGGSSAHYAYLKCYDRDGNHHDLTFLCENASISTYDELAKYLINYGFTEGEISSGEYSNIGLPVTDTGYHPVFSMQASANTSSGETSYDIYCYELVISSGEIIRNEIYIDSNNDFSIYHI